MHENYTTFNHIVNDTKSINISNEITRHENTQHSTILLMTQKV